MNSKRLALAIGLIAVGVGPGGFMLFRAYASPTPPPPVMFSYAAKWICNYPNTIIPVPFSPNAAENIGLVAGEYKTDINVHNPSNATMNAIVQKKFVLSTPEPAGTPPIFVIKNLGVHPDASFFIDCNDIFATLSANPSAVSIITLNGGAAKGFVVLTTHLMVPSTPLLDVVAEYSQIGYNCVNVPTCVAVGSSLEVEQIPARPFVP